MIIGRRADSKLIKREETSDSCKEKFPFQLII